MASVQGSWALLPTSSVPAMTLFAFGQSYRELEPFGAKRVQNKSHSVFVSALTDLIDLFIKD